MNPTKISFNELIKTLKPGQTICVKNGERGVLNWLISSSQKHLLKDLNPKLPLENRIAEEDILLFSSFTHAMMVFDTSVLVNDIEIAENFYPKTRKIPLSKKITSGYTIIVTENRAVNTPEKIMSVKYNAAVDVLAGVPYSWWKLFYYYGYEWGWQKTLLGKPIMNIFKKGLPGKKDNEYQVCSGSCWKWYINSIDLTTVKWLNENDQMPEMWYPARMASDSYYMKIVGIYEII